MSSDRVAAALYLGRIRQLLRERPATDDRRLEHAARMLNSWAETARKAAVRSVTESGEVDALRRGIMEQDAKGQTVWFPEFGSLGSPIASSAVKEDPRP